MHESQNSVGSYPADNIIVAASEIVVMATSAYTQQSRHSQTCAHTHTL